MFQQLADHEERKRVATAAVDDAAPTPAAAPAVPAPALPKKAKEVQYETLASRLGKARHAHAHGAHPGC
jgi:hypothetical protein